MTQLAEWDETGLERSRPDVLDVLSTNGRHASLAVMCGLLHSVIVGRAAESLLAEGPEALPEMGGLWIAPSFGWLVPRIDVGRKDRGPRGTRLRLPVRLQWPHVIETVPISATRRPATFGWVTTSMGHHGIGETQIHLSYGLDTWEVAESEAGIPVQAYGPVMTREQMWAHLLRVYDEGVTAEFEFIMGLEKRVSTALARAHSSLAREVADYTGIQAPLLDSTKIEKVRDQMLLGLDGQNAKVRQMLNRLIDPITLNKVDPWKYIEVALRRDAKEELRREIGDPRVGAKVREVHKSLGYPDLDHLVSVFREMYPKAHLSHDRARAALDVRSDPMAEWCAILVNDEAEDDEEHIFGLGLFDPEADEDPVEA